MIPSKNFTPFKSMSSEGQKCGLSSFLSMSCRGRVEAFAKKLNSRLKTLGSDRSDDDNGSADESSWLAANENQVSLSQPRQNLDLDLELDSPGSPAPEPEKDEARTLINKDTLCESISNLRHSHSTDCQCPNSKEYQKNLSKVSSSNDSDSDCTYYDTESDLEQRLGGYLNGDNNSESSRSQDTISTTQDETFATTSDCTPQPSSSSGNTSTLSLRDEDCPSLETNGSSDVSRCEGAGDDFNSNSATIAPVQGTRKSDEETYVSHLTVDGDLTVECTNILETTAELAINGSLSSTLSNGAQKEHSTEDHLNLEDEEAEGRSPRVKRCSSLKSGKTPPSTPGEKKIVRFADVLGLDLADVRTFLDEIPKVPVSAFTDLPGADLDRPSSFSAPSTIRANRMERFLMPLFQQPGGLPNFLDLVKERQVCLENAFVKDSTSLAISGIVRVRNLDFHKSLHIRYSLDSWKTFADVQATYVNNSCDGFSDKFSFLLYAHTLSVGQRIEFACRFHCKGGQYWDNNNGANYCFQCLPTTTRSTPRYSPIEDCGASFY